MEEQVKEKANEISDLLINDLFDDVNLRYEYIADLKDEKKTAFNNLSQEEKENEFNLFFEDQMHYCNKSKTAVDRETDVSVLFYHYKDKDADKISQLLKTFNSQVDIESDDIGAIIEKEKSLVNPEEFQKAREKFLYSRIFSQENKFRMKKVFDAQTQRYTPLAEDHNFGYCLRAYSLSMYKQNKDYGLYDFLPSKIEDSISNIGFVSHIQNNHPSFIIENQAEQSIAEVVSSQNLRPGTIIVEKNKSGKPQHAMMFTHLEGEEPILMSFNNESKKTKASLNCSQKNRQAFIINLPELIRQSVYNAVDKLPQEEQGAFLDGLRSKILKKSRVEKNFNDMTDEGKKLSPKEQWQSYYKRSDVKFDSKMRIEETRARLTKNQKKISRQEVKPSIQPQFSR
ncbi:MAG: hypothetical protein R3Y43_08495 [Alphaproteobacteria bacterium]